MTDHMTIAHRWAQDRNASLRGYAMHCRDGMIFSHGEHFVIARFVNTPARRGKPSRRVVLFTERGYSVSTAKHKTYVWRALDYGRSREVYTVPELDRYGDNYGNPAVGKLVLDWHLAQALECYQKGLRARVYGESHYERAREFLNKAEAFADAFGHKFKRPLNLDAMARELAVKAAKQAKVAAKAQAERARKAEEARKAQQAQDAERFQEWRNGEPVTCPASYRSRDDGSAYVTRTRLDDGSYWLRTSQGASVPWEHAVKAFRFIALCVARGEAWHTNGRVVRVGHYQVDSIEPNGDMRAGCHRFAWSEMRDLAEREGVRIGFAGEAEAKAAEAEAVEVREGAH